MTLKTHASPRRIFYALVLALFANLVSCGYRFSAQYSRLPERIKTVSVSVFKNNTKEPNLELAVTEAIAETLRHDGRLELVSGKSADSAVSGSVEQYRLDPLAFDTLNRAAQYRVRIKIKIKFEDKAPGGEVLEKTLETQWDYATGGAITSAEKARQDAINRASAYLGDKVVGVLFEGF